MVPPALCIGTDLYQRYVSMTGLRDRILLALHKKPFEEMRWEELWDTALRIRHFFMNTEMPAALRRELSTHLTSVFSNRPVVVRSSAPGEDSSKTSFAGLHESFVNIRGTEAILDHIRLVWASLWSDRALLYRQELGLDVEKSAMAVVVQELISGERSGVVFGESPVDERQAVIEAVYGLNQGLVDGTIEPDRWILQRKTGKIIEHHSADRQKVLRPGREGIRVETLPSRLRERPPLDSREVSKVFAMAMKAESFFGSPQDMEWTYAKETLYMLQARPITARSEGKGDQRPWYLSLHRSFENLKLLRTKIEKEILPAMEMEASEWANIDLAGLSDHLLADDIEARRRRYDYWLERYRQDCIPFAHGMRLFGQFYNDMVKPSDPFEFTKLLEGLGMISIRRNHMLKELANRIRDNSKLAECLNLKDMQDCDPEFAESFDTLYDQFGDLAWEEARFLQNPQQLFDLLIEMASHQIEGETLETDHVEKLEKDFLSKCEEEQRTFAVELMDLGRASYRLRDDDNIYLGKIEGQVLASIEEGKNRLYSRYDFDRDSLDVEEVIKALRNPSHIPAHRPPSAKTTREKNFKLRARQIVGQPAGPGIAIGKARVILEPPDLFQFKAGEILVCDSVDPGMTFVVPLAAGIVERRGGMLIHGAIIAREYGLPCVTGAPDVAKWVKTGDRITVDGYLGIVIISERMT